MDKLGAIGEKIASEYLVKMGYRPISSNDRFKDGEIDLVMSKDGLLVFVEVKTMKDRGDDYLVPEDNMTAAKMRKFGRACELYIARHPELVDERLGWRMDLVAVSVGSTVAIRHYENV